MNDQQKRTSISAGQDATITHGQHTSEEYALAPNYGYVTIAVVAILYIVLFYFSYYTEKPRITSSKIISFMNCACMGLIFGFHFNRNLKESKESKSPDMGSAYAIAFVASLLCIVIPFVYSNSSPTGNLAESYRGNPTTDSYQLDTPQVEPEKDGTQPLAKTPEAERITIPLTNSTITIPSGWKYKEEVGNNNAGVSGLSIYPPYADGSADMTVAIWDISENLNEVDLNHYGEDIATEDLNEEFVLDSNRGLLGSVANEKAELVVINENSNSQPT